MQRTRNVVLVSVLVAAAILAGALALAAYRGKVVAASEEHEHEFMDHEHAAPSMPDSLPTGESGERREPRPDAEEPQAQPEAADDHAGHEHHDH